MSVAMNRVLRATGWLFIAIGTLVLLYLVYSLLYTNRATAVAQDEIADEWELGLTEPTEDDGNEEDTGDDTAAPRPGSAVAALEFRRPGLDAPLVHEKPLYVVEGVTLGDLQRGPGHYPGTALPGDDGNFAIAGHRTTYGAPFYNLDQLERGDEVIVTTRNGSKHTYRVRSQEIVQPGDTWVISPDPLERGKPTLTLTTCHPRFSNAQRMIVFAELVA